MVQRLVIRREAGFTYALAMLLVAAMSVLALRGVQITLTKERREKETQLLEVGAMYYLAIKNYYEGTPGSVKTYPPSLESLLLDERKTTLQRHLRRQYRDPLTGDKQWGIVASPDGGVMGVFSLSRSRPIKTGGFPEAVRVIHGATEYREWQFVYQPH